MQTSDGPTASLISPFIATRSIHYHVSPLPVTIASSLPTKLYLLIAFSYVGKTLCKIMKRAPATTARMRTFGQRGDVKMTHGTLKLEHLFLSSR